MAKTTPAAPLFKALGAYKSILISVGCFTALINLLMLVPSIYMLQVYDRVLSSQNETTLVMLTLMVVGFFAFIGTLEVVRSFIVIVPNGESGWIVMSGRQPLFWIPNQRAALPKAVKAVTTQAKR